MPSDRKIYMRRDAVAEAIQYVAPFLPPDTLVTQDIPDDMGWEDVGLVVQISDAGGPGERDVVLDDVALAYEVNHPDSTVAQHWASVLHGLLADWQNGSAGVYWWGTVQRPTYQRDAGTGRPFYSGSVIVTFRMHPHTIAPTGAATPEED